MWAAARRELLVAVAALVVQSAATVGLVLLGERLLAAILGADRAGGGLGDLVGPAAALLVVSAASSAAGAVAEAQQQLMTELTGRHAQARVLDVACAVELEAFDDPAFHDRVARAQSATQRCDQAVWGLAALLQAVTGAAGSVLALLALQPLLVPLALLAIVPIALSAARRGSLFWRFAYGMTPRDRERGYLAGLLTARDAAKEVRAFNLAGFLRGRHDRLYAERIAELRRIVRRQLALSLGAGAVTGLITATVLVLLVALALDDRVSLAGAAAGAGAIVLLGQRLGYAGFGAERLLENALFVNDLLALLALEPRAEGGAGRARGELEIVAEDVSFTYPGANEPTLHDVSVRIAPGEVVALVGHNGSGKTTLAKLLAGLYVPTAGRVLWGGVDTRVADRATLRSHAAVIFQDFVRYGLPARDNVGLGRHERLADVAGIRAAAVRAGADEDLAALPQGYETILGPAFWGGTDLSLGQWQRVALARLFFRDAPVVILDEPTASLDARAEHELFARIRSLLAGRSVLLISHRFSSVRAADRIYVLDGGRVVEAGTHEELVARGGTYAELFALQAEAYRG